MAKKKTTKVSTGDPIKDFLTDVNSAFDGSITSMADDLPALNLKRFSSGSLPLDLVLGGGWPFSRISIIAGDESTGKTALALKAMKEVQSYDRETHQHRDFLADKTKFQKGRALFVDLEGTFDSTWASHLGVDTSHHLVAIPEHQQQAIDIVSKAIRENVVDLIIIDSLAAMSPIEEIEASSEEYQMGLIARKNNQAFRKWVGSLNRASQDHPQGGPAVIVLNQFRVDIGKFMGDPRVLPGGKAQRFAASIIVYTKTPEYEDTASEAHEFVKLKGVTPKNKTYVPKLSYVTKMWLKDSEDGTVGHIDNIKPLMAMGKACNLINTTKKVTFHTFTFDTQKEMSAQLASNPSMYRLLWRSIVKSQCGTTNI